MRKKTAVRFLIPVALVLVILAVVSILQKDGEEPLPREEMPQVKDLVQALPGADFVADTPHFVFGTPQGKHHYAEIDLRYHEACQGWYSWFDEASDLNMAFLVGGSGTFRMTVLHPGSCSIELEGCAVEGGDSTSAALRLYCNDRLVGSGALARGKTPEKVRFYLSEDFLVPGDNRFRIEVDDGVKTELPGLVFPVTLSAGFVSIRLEGVDAPDPPQPIAIPDNGAPDEPALIQPSGTLVDFYHCPKRGERLRGAVRVKGRPLQVGVRIRAAENGIVDEPLARIRAPAQDALEFDLDLSDFSGRACRITFGAGVPGAAKAGSYARWERLAITRPDSGGSIDEEPAREKVRGADEQEIQPPAREKVPGSDAPPGEQPSIVVLLLDAASSFFFESITGKSGVTPAADALANDAVVFTQAVAPAPYTLPSVGSLMTGRLPDRHGVVFSANRDGKNLRLHQNVDTVASVLKKAGYATYAVVTNPNAAGIYGYDKGFDRYEELFNEPDLWDQGVEPSSAVMRARALIEAHEKKGGAAPFFIYIHLFQPHAPYTPPKSFIPLGTGAGAYEGPVDGGRAVIDGFKHLGKPDLGPDDFAQLKNLYAANLAYVDDAVSGFLNWMCENRLYDSSLIVLCSDHGEAFGEHRTIEHGHHLYDEALRVPMMIKYPDNRHAGLRIERTVSLLDLSSTLAAVGGGDIQGLTEDGMNLAALLEDEAAWPDRTHLARSDVFKPSFSLRWHGYHYIFDSLNRREELYFMPGDPRQNHNLIDERKIIAGYLRTRLYHQLRALFHAQGGEEVEVDETFVQAVEGLGYTGGSGDSRSGWEADRSLPAGRR